MKQITLTAKAISRIVAPQRGQVEVCIKGHPGLSLLAGKTTMSWILRHSRRGKRQTIKLADYEPGQDLRALGDEANTKLAAMTNGADLAAARRNEKGMEFEALADLFLQKHKCKASTRKEYRRQIEHDLMPSWRGRRASSITKADVIDLLDKVGAVDDAGQDEDDPKTRVTANRVLAVTSAIFKFAVSRDVVAANPCEHILKPAAEHARERRLNDDELRRLYEVLESQHEDVRDAYTMLILTGARVSEVIELTFAEVDLDRGIWTLPASKSKSAKEIIRPIVGRVLAILRRRSAANPDTVYVFPGRKQNDHMSADRGRAEIKKLCTFATPWQARDLRRTAATHFGRLGGRFITGMLLGHSDFSVTDKHYDGHDYMGEMKRTLLAWDREFERIVSGKAEASNVIPMFA
jgi:integrase